MKINIDPFYIFVSIRKIPHASKLNLEKKNVENLKKFCALRD